MFAFYLNKYIFMNRDVFMKRFFAKNNAFIKRLSGTL